MEDDKALKMVKMQNGIIIMLYDEITCTCLYVCDYIFSYTTCLERCGKYVGNTKI